MLTRDKSLLRVNGAEGAAIGVLARDILAEARRALNGEVSDAEAVHNYRKAMKRWRALLRLLEPFLGAEGRALRTQATELARGLAGARDAQSALDAIADLKKGETKIAAKSLAAMRSRLEEMRKAAEMMSLTAETRDKLLQALDRAEAAIAQWPLAELGFARIAGELAASYRRARKAIPSSWARADAAELHEFRKRVIVQRYQMELVTPLWPRSGKLWTGEAQRLRDRLGHYQDLVLLTELSAPRRPLARWRAKLAPLISARKAQHVAAARRIAGRLFAEKPKAFRRRLEALWAIRDKAA